MTEGKTNAPARYTEGTLIDQMDKKGLGTVATRADIIDKLFSSFLLEKKGEEIYTTAKARQLLELVPEDGWILAPVTVEFTAGQSVFDVLLATVKAQAIHMEYQNTPMYETACIEGIGNLYEFDCGALSGWMYRVNGWFPNYGCSRYAVQAGDVIEWMYTCDLGSDVGGSGVSQGYDE